MSTTSSLLGTSQFAGNFRLDFYAKDERVAVKLYQADRKQGVFYLEGFPFKSPLTYENLPEFARLKIDSFLVFHNVRINPERVSIASPLETLPVSLLPSSFQTPKPSSVVYQQEYTPPPQAFHSPYMASVKGPFIGSFPQFISRRFVLSFSHNHCHGTVRLYDLEKNELVCDMPKWHISLQEPPLYENPSSGKTEVITGWDFQQRNFITTPQNPTATHEYTKTVTPEGKLIITTPRGVHELNDAVSCHFELEDYIDPDDYGPYPEKLVCDDTVVMGKKKIAILKNNGELHVWDLDSNSRVHLFSEHEVVKYGLASQDIDYDNWICQCFFHGDKLLVRKSEYLQETNRFNIHLFQFEFNPFAIKEHQFDEEEVFKKVFDDKVLTLYQQGLYFRKLCSDEPRILFMELGFNIKKTYDHENFLLLVAENNDTFLIDLKNRTKTQIIPSTGEIDFEKIDGMKFVDGSLFLIERNSEFKTFGFKLHSFDFSTQTSSNSPVLHGASSSQANLPSHYKEKDLESRLTSFLIRRVCTVGWDPTNTLVFIRDLKENFPKEVVSQELIRIIIDTDHLNDRFSSTRDRPLIPCFASYILKELEALPSINVKMLLSKGLEALEDTYQLRCPAKDGALNSHFSDIRRETMATFVDMVNRSSEEEIPDLIDFLVSTYKNIDQGRGLKNNLRFNGEIWEMKRAIILTLTEAAKKASQKSLERICDVYIEALERSDRNETSILQAIKTFAQLAPQKIPFLLIALSKAIEDENQHPHKKSLFMGSEDVFKSIVRGISIEQKMHITEFLRPIAEDQQDGNSRYAIIAQQLLEKTL
ncbi:MAG: hypothetical protein KDK96_08920 [Chlamydiia bacterium]|nr:hypothetical protein [Chlamydiia bacterium]